MRTIIDILMALVLVFVLLWCGLLAWNAYCHHRDTLYQNERALEALKKNMNIHNKKHCSKLKEKNNIEIDRLQIAQEKLFDANSVSFNFQFVTLIIFTLGISAFTWFYSMYRREQERAENLEQERAKTIGALAPFAAGQNIGAIIASKYSLQYTLCRIYRETSGKERDSSLYLISDFQNDIFRHLEFVIREKEGLEPVWHEMILDLADRVERVLLEIKNEVDENVKSLIDRILLVCSKSTEILWDYGEKFEERYIEYWRMLTGEEPPKRKL